VNLLFKKSHTLAPSLPSKAERVVAQTTSFSSTITFQKLKQWERERAAAKVSWDGLQRIDINAKNYRTLTKLC
jgi:hypothetical protein